MPENRGTGYPQGYPDLGQGDTPWRFQIPAHPRAGGGTDSAPSADPVHATIPIAWFWRCNGPGRWSDHGRNRNRSRYKAFRYAHGLASVPCAARRVQAGRAAAATARRSSVCDPPWPIFSSPPYVRRRKMLVCRAGDHIDLPLNLSRPPLPRIPPSFRKSPGRSSHPCRPYGISLSKEFSCLVFLDGFLPNARSFPRQL